MRARLMGLCSVVMLLICLAAAVMEAISYIWPGDAHYYWPQRSVDFARNVSETTSIAYSKGRFSVGGLYPGSMSVTMATIEGELMLPDPYAKGTGFWNHLGFSYRVGTKVGHGGWGIAFPLWAPILLMLPMPLIWLREEVRRQQKRRRGGKDLCVNCGYNLFVSENRCPECGAPYHPRREQTEWVAKVFGLRPRQPDENRRRA